MAHIGLFIPSLEGGGAERVMVNLSRGFCALGVETDLVVTTAKGHLLSEVHESVNLIDLGASRTALSLLPLVRYLRRCKPEALLSTMIHSNVVALAALKLARSTTRGFVREATTLSKEKDQARGLVAKSLFRVVRTIYPWSDGVFAPSNGVARDLRRYLDGTRIDVIPNPVITPELETLKNEAVEHEFLNTENKVFLAVGRLTQAKGYETLLRGFSLVRRTLDAKLIILGEGELRKSLEDQVRSLGLATHVSMPGFVDNPFAYMKRCSVFVLSSRWEGLPNVLIQALACGCSVVSTNCESGPSEILDDGRLGSLVPVDNPEALANAMIRALSRTVHADMDRELARYQMLSVAQRYLDRIVGS